MSSNPTRKDIIQAILTNPKLSEEEKSALVEEFIDEIKKEYPDLKYHATKSDVKEVELKLTKEIEEVRKEIKEVDLKLTKDIKGLEVKLGETKFSILKWQFIFWIGQMGAIIGLGITILKFLNKG